MPGIKPAAFYGYFYNLYASIASPLNWPAQTELMEEENVSFVDTLIDLIYDRNVGFKSLRGNEEVYARYKNALGALADIIWLEGKFGQALLKTRRLLTVNAAEGREKLYGFMVKLAFFDILIQKRREEAHAKKLTPALLQSLYTDLHQQLQNVFQTLENEVIQFESDKIGNNQIQFYFSLLKSMGTVAAALIGLAAALYLMWSLLLQPRRHIVCTSKEGEIIFNKIVDPGGTYNKIRGHDPASYDCQETPIPLSLFQLAVRIPMLIPVLIISYLILTYFKAEIEFVFHVLKKFAEFKDLKSAVLHIYSEMIKDDQKEISNLFNIISEKDSIDILPKAPLDNPRETQTAKPKKS